MHVTKTLSRLYIFLVFLVLAMPAVETWAEEPNGGFFKEGAPVEITADYLSYDKGTDTYLARGNVVIVQEGVTLTTESAMLDMASGVATASGGVVAVDEGGNVVEGEDLRLDINKKTAVLAKGRIFFKADNVHITGDEIRKTGKETYEADRATYTTCDCPEGKRPAWDFSSSRANITLGEYLTGTNATFRLKGVPLLYSPYVVVPVKRGRQTGFLTPKPGYSKLRGFILDVPFFWAISKNTDATFYLDLETERGLGKGVEFRYIRTRKSSGEFFFYHYREKDIDRVREFREDVGNLSRPLSATNDRWELKYDHTEVLAYGVTLKADINIVSDDEYFIDFGADGNRSLESLETNLSISKRWSQYNLVTQFRVFDNLLKEDDSSELMKLPEVTFTSSNQKVGKTPFYISSSSSYINFVREEGDEGQRLDMLPRLSLPLSPRGYFDFTPSFGPRATFWLAKDGSENRFSDRYLYDATVDLITTFVRVYFPESKDIEAVKHTLRPKLSYTYIPESVQTGLPNFDGVDRIEAANKFTYSLNSILTGKYLKGERNEYLDHVYMEISQSFDINEATRKLVSETDRRKPLSELSGELVIRPAAWSRMSGKGKYDVYEDWFTSYDADLELTDSRGDSLYLAHRFVRDSTNYFEGSARLHVNANVDLTYRKRFSFDEESDIETIYGIVYSHQCWSAYLTYTERIEESVVYLTVDLMGIGRVAGVKTTIDSP